MITFKFWNKHTIVDFYLVSFYENFITNYTGIGYPLLNYKIDFFFCLFSFDSKSGLHCLNSMFRKSFYKLNSPKERLFLSTSFLNCFHNHQKQHHFFLIDFHLIKHFLTNVQQIRYM